MYSNRTGRIVISEEAFGTYKTTTMEEFLSNELLQRLQDDNTDSDQGDVIGPEQEPAPF